MSQSFNKEIKTVLVTGGMGFIGSHTVIELINKGYQPIIVDNLVNSKADVLQRIKQITSQDVPFYAIDVCHFEALENIFTSHSIDAVIHFAALKAVGESVNYPLNYYQNNVNGLLNLLSVMAKYDCKQLVFSSSATVYGNPDQVPIEENAPLFATNPYGQTKIIAEQILRDMFHADSNWRIAILRYFNPAGAHPSGLLGEDPQGVPNNLMPFIAQVAAGKQPCLYIHGNDYPTHDGTGVRDYIHIGDLANGHVAALKQLANNSQLFTVNLGTGIGYSVLQAVHTFEKVSGQKIPYVFKSRRPGDIASCYASATYAKTLLDWHAQLDLETMCKDHWCWQKNHSFLK